tara:strand:+ start:22155 stop:22355 length:201 start_codon:yes stop_codon:yes gene_type:complete
MNEYQVKKMAQIFATDLNLSPLSISAIIISGLGFIIMFGIASAKGGYQDLINTTLENDARQRRKND